jgi:hypothetical protein
MLASVDKKVGSNQHTTCMSNELNSADLHILNLDFELQRAWHWYHPNFHPQDNWILESGIRYLRKTGTATSSCSQGSPSLPPSPVPPLPASPARSTRPARSAPAALLAAHSRLQQRQVAPHPPAPPARHPAGAPAPARPPPATPRPSATPRTDARAPPL